MINYSTCLQHLNLYDIRSLTAFPTNGLPTSLKSLVIRECENLTFLPPETWSNYTSLVTLDLQSSCNALASFPLNCFPMLQVLSIRECRSLESIFISETSSCSSSTLQYFDVGDCEALRSLPQRMDTLTALENISLRNLPNLNLSLCDGTFLPPNLQSIYVDSVRITKPVKEWGLHSLTSVSSMFIGGDDIVNMFLKEPLLPISLVKLSIRNLSEMKSLERNGLGHLYSLERLELSNCSKLESLPEKTFPSFLKHLNIWLCPRLESLPEDSLPSALEQLYIEACSLLEERYKRKEHWSKIAHIPVIKINDQITIWALAIEKPRKWRTFPAMILNSIETHPYSYIMRDQNTFETMTKTQFLTRTQVSNSSAIWKHESEKNEVMKMKVFIWLRMTLVVILLL